jgi:hypothetical protein
VTDLTRDNANIYPEASGFPSNPEDGWEHWDTTLEKGYRYSAAAQAWIQVSATGGINPVEDGPIPWPEASSFPSGPQDGWEHWDTTLEKGYRYSATAQAWIHVSGTGGLSSGGGGTSVPWRTSLHMQTTSVTEVQIEADYKITDDTGTVLMDSVGTSLVDITLSGAGGLDTGSEASSTWYYIYMISDGDATHELLLSASPTSPTLPGGYPYKRLIGAVYNDSSSDLYPFWQDNEIVMWASRAIVSATAPGSLTALNVTSFFPMLIAKGLMFQQFSRNSGSGAAYIYISHTATAGFSKVGGAVAAGSAVHDEYTDTDWLPRDKDENTNIYWQGGGTQNVLYSTGFKMDFN